MRNKRVIVYGTVSEQALVRTIEELRRENAALLQELNSLKSALEALALSTMQKQEYP